MIATPIRIAAFAMCLAGGLMLAAGPAAAQAAAVVRGLDKVTGHTKDITAPIGRVQRFGTLEIIARACQKAAPEETPEVKVFIEVFDTPVPRDPNAKPERVKIKEGWVFASSPALNALEHPTYDVWAVDCRS
jgi:hypothetical protein